MINVCIVSTEFLPIRWLFVVCYVVSIIKESLYWVKCLHFAFSQENKRILSWWLELWSYLKCHISYLNILLVLVMHQCAILSNRPFGYRLSVIQEKMMNLMDYRTPTIKCVRLHLSFWLFHLYMTHYGHIWMHITFMSISFNCTAFSILRVSAHSSVRTSQQIFTVVKHRCD